MGRSRRSTPRTGKPATWGRTAACRSRSRLQRDGDTLVNTGVVAWPDEDSAWSTVRRMQLKLHRWASEDAARRFGDLFNLVYDPAFLIHAWERVHSNDGARTAGIDGLTVAQIETRVGVHAFLGQVRDLLKSGEYRPSGFLRARGEQKSARALLEDAHDLYRRRLVPDHPETRTAAYVLADNLRALGRPHPAPRVLKAPPRPTGPRAPPRRAPPQNPDHSARNS